MGMPNLLARLASCCHPLAGDPITGFVTRSRGVSVHRAECRNVQNVEEPDRLIDVSWGTPSQRYTARVSIQAWDRVGLLSDIASLLSRRAGQHQRGAQLAPPQRPRDRNLDAADIGRGAAQPDAPAH